METRKYGGGHVINDTTWVRLMGYGKRLGCHQMPERSFFIRGYQFPVCARCTGVLISSIIACFIFVFYRIDFKICIALSGIMFLDWLIQHIGIRESTNPRRFVTGLIGGLGFMTLQLYVYRAIIMFAGNGIQQIIGR